MQQEISIYIHVPFCTKKCPYCHFYVVPNQSRYHSLLYEGLCLEWEKNLPLLEEKKVVSIYFGGGTPSLFGPQYIGSLLEKIRQGVKLTDDCEITLEANPEEAGAALLGAYRDVGINRLSLGVQSLDDRSLESLERTHSATKAIEALENAKTAGFSNVSIDLMYDLPNQTEASWQATLDRLPFLPFQHLSLYNLTVEPHPPFFKRKPTLPDSQTSFRMLNQALDAIKRVGLERYEISAFARKSFRSRHNLGYWTGRPFLGYGPSAFSYWNGERFRNVANLLRYHRNLKENLSPIDFREQLSPVAKIKELLAVELRVLKGVKISHSYPEETIHALNRLVKEGLLIQNGERIALTERGTLFYDTVASELI